MSKKHQVVFKTGLTFKNPNRVEGTGKDILENIKNIFVYELNKMNIPIEKPKKKFVNVKESNVNLELIDLIDSSGYKTKGLVLSFQSDDENKAKAVASISQDQQKKLYLAVKTVGGSNVFNRYFNEGVIETFKPTSPCLLTGVPAPAEEASASAAPAASSVTTNAFIVLGKLTDGEKKGKKDTPLENALVEKFGKDIFSFGTIEDNDHIKRPVIKIKGLGKEKVKEVLDFINTKSPQSGAELIEKGEPGSSLDDACGVLQFYSSITPG